MRKNNIFSNIFGDSNTVAQAKDVAACPEGNEDPIGLLIRISRCNLSQGRSLENKDFMIRLLMIAQEIKEIINVTDFW